MLKKYGLLLGGFGFSYLGNWIYLIALNILILDLTGSAAAVAGIYIIGPAARILTSFFAGSIIDRSNKRKIMITTDIVRGLLVCFVPFMESIGVIYIILFITNIAGAFFGPSSTYYITKYVANDDKKKFNAWLGMMSSGAFLLGPALGGVLISSLGITWTIIVNGLTFFICALTISMLPRINEIQENIRQNLTLRVIAEDYIKVQSFIKSNRIFFLIYLIFQSALMVGFALDSQEVTFLKLNLSLSDQTYGVIVSIAGVGSLIGASVAAGLAKKLSLKAYLSFGLFFTMICYTAFYASFNFWSALVAFICLGFFMAFSNVGYETFYQRNVPPELMGRFGSLASIYQNVVQILLTSLLGVCAELFTLQQSAIGFGLLSIVGTFMLIVIVYSAKSARLFNESSSERKSTIT